MRPLLIASTLALLLSATSAPAGATSATIQPGIEITSGGAQCTLAWIFDDADSDEVYGTTAAHCVSGVGAVVYHDGSRIGAVAWRSPTLDFVLIDIDDGRRGDVDGEMRGHPGVPTRVATLADTGLGTLCQFSGYGTGYRYTAATREERTGLLTHNDGWQHYCQFPVTPGDSGGPVAVTGGLALGVVNTVGVAVDCCAGVPVHAGEGGVTLQGALVEAAMAGHNLVLRPA